MEIKFLGEQGQELFLKTQLNGNIRAFTDQGLVYVGRIHGQVDTAPSGGCNCDCTSITPHYSLRPGQYVQGFKDEYGEYNKEEIKVSFNFNDTLPGGLCSGEKVFIFCNDAIIACSWHLEDGWIIESIIEVIHIQAY